MGVPSIEKCPSGLDSRWQAVWRLARDEMKRIGTFSASMRPLLDEYIEALRESRAHRELAREEPVRKSRDSGLPSMHSGFASADREAKRALALAEALGLTPKAQKALSVKAEGVEDGDNADPFSALDELEPRRRQRKAG